METFRERDLVELVLVEPSRRDFRIVIELKGGEKTSTHYGNISHNDIIGNSPGLVVKSSTGNLFLVLKPTLSSKIKKSKLFKFVTQIIYPRDWGLIIAFSNIRSGSKIVEIGTGSGALTLFFSNIIGEKGHIWSYEIDPNRLEVAKGNLDRLANYRNYTLRLYDEKKGILERDVDAIFIDIPEPWTIIKEAWYALAPSGFLIVYIPTFNQLKQVVEEVIRNGFVDLRIIEGFTREIQWKPYAIRPQLESYVFSAYILFSKKSYFIPRKMLKELRDRP